MATNNGWNVIYSYARAQALADGVLIYVTAQAKSPGFRVPVAVTVIDRPNGASDVHP